MSEKITHVRVLKTTRDKLLKIRKWRSDRKGKLENVDDVIVRLLHVNLMTAAGRTP